MTPKKIDLAKDTKQVLIYVKADKLEKFDALCGMVPRNRMLNKLMDDFIEEAK